MGGVAAVQPLTTTQEKRNLEETHIQETSIPKHGQSGGANIVESLSAVKTVELFSPSLVELTESRRAVLPKLSNKTLD